jgi:RNA polymerase sigma-70 factor (ECF subfamily)
VGRFTGLREDELQELHEAYRGNVGAVYAFFTYSVDADTAEDLTAATFERVVRSWRRYRADRASVRTWVLVIARNILTDHFRRQRHRGGPSLDEHPALATWAAPDDDPARRWASIDAIKGWLRELQPREREVLALRYGADMPTDEIARCLGLSEANVHQIASRARRRLRAIMGETTDGAGVRAGGSRAAAASVSGSASPAAGPVRSGTARAAHPRA